MEKLPLQTLSSIGKRLQINAKRKIPLIEVHLNQKPLFMGNFPPTNFTPAINRRPNSPLIHIAPNVFDC